MFVRRGAAAHRRRYVRALVPTVVVVAALAVWTLAGPLAGWVAVAALALLPAAAAVAADRFRSLGHAVVRSRTAAAGWSPDTDRSSAGVASSIRTV
ncbi:MAG TPA: hypothetical protein VIM10_17535 [Actinopolymorphaceae bacterium]